MVFVINKPSTGNVRNVREYLFSSEYLNDLVLQNVKRGDYSRY